MTQYDLELDRLTIHLSKKEEQPGNQSDVALFTLLKNPFGSFGLIFCPS